MEEIQPGEAAGHGVDGEVLRIFGPTEPRVDVVVNPVEVALEECANGILIASASPLNQGAIIVGWCLRKDPHWDTLWVLPQRRRLRVAELPVSITVTF